MVQTIIQLQYKAECLIFSFLAEATLTIKEGLAISHSVFVKGDHTNFEIDPSFGVEASQLYPYVNYTAVEEYLDTFVWEFRKQGFTSVLLFAMQTSYSMFALTLNQFKCQFNSKQQERCIGSCANSNSISNRGASMIS